MIKKVNDFISKINAEDPTVNIYTMSKKPQRKTLEKKYDVKFATVKGESKDYILRALKNFLENNFEKIKEVQDYFDFNIDEEGFYLSIDSDRVKEFDFVHNRMKEKQKLPSLKNITNETTCIIVELIFDGNQYLFFQKTNTRSRFKRNFTSILLENGIFNKIVEPKTEALEFPPSFDFVYFDDSKEFLIFDKYKFERSFDFKEFYEKNSKEAIKILEGKKFVFSTTIKEELLAMPKYNSKFTKVLLSKGLEQIEKRDLKPYEEEFGITLKKDKNGNIKIITQDDLEGLLKILQKECVVEVSTREKYFSRSKIRALIGRVGEFLK